ncbi:hypothetical protein D3C83_17440 [compost metagenome]
MDHDHHGRRAKLRYRRKIADQVVPQFLIQGRIDRMRGCHHEKRIAIRRRFCGELRTDVGAGAGPVVDDDLLAQALAQAVSDGAAQRVGAASGWKRQDEAYRSYGIFGV